MEKLHQSSQSSFFVLSGFLLGLFFRDRHFGNSVTISLLIFAIFLFIFYPVSGEQINVKIGLNRVVFTVCCFIFCLSFYKLNVQFPKVIHRPLTQLGEVSYSVYLLHPIIYYMVGQFRDHTFHFPESLRLVLSVIVTFVTSYFVYQYFEKYFMRLGKSNSGIAQ
ncbi:MAG: acyltransferase family protein [Flavobacteriales bacterium]